MLSKETRHSWQEHQDCSGANVNKGAAFRIRSSIFSDVVLLHWRLVSGSNVMFGDVECRLSCCAPLIRSWFRGLPHFYVQVLVLTGSHRDFLQCRAEVSVPNTSGHVTHVYRLGRAKLSLCVKLDMPKRFSSDVELVPFTRNKWVDPAAWIGSRRIHGNVASTVSGITDVRRAKIGFIYSARA